jgi:predicted enzyme related to lactoylglutathione lyase
MDDSIRAAPTGTFRWFELTSGEFEREGRFYAELLRATARATGSERVEFELDGAPIAGLVRGAGDQPRWLPHIAVDDLDGCRRRAAELGGRVLDARRPSPVGVCAIIEDPTGGVVALVETRAGAIRGRCGDGQAFAWCELVTRDVPRASEFYAKLLGWTPQFRTAGATSFIEMKAGETAVASVFEACADEERSQAHWCPYLRVDDIETALLRAVRHGGRKLCEPMEIPGIGRYAGVTDPAGAHLAFLEPSDPDSTA